MEYKFIINPEIEKICEEKAWFSLSEMYAEDAVKKVMEGQ